MQLPPAAPKIPSKSILRARTIAAHAVGAGLALAVLEPRTVLRLQGLGKRHPHVDPAALGVEGSGR